MSQNCRESAYANICFGLEIDNKLIFYTQTQEKKDVTKFYQSYHRAAQKKH
jgi:hypothetical protein